MLLRKVLYIFTIVTLVLTVLSYGFYKALPLILGPKIEISSPQNGDIVEGTTVVLRGTVERSQKLYINGVARPFSATGLFETKIPVFPGNNIVSITSIDRFNRSVTMHLTLGTK